MKKISHQDFKRQITNLIPIVEMYIPLIEEVEKSQKKLNTLPSQLEKLKQRLELLKHESSSANSYNSSSQIQETEFELDFLVDDLEGILVHLTSFDCQLKNLVALKERLEAVQEERIGGFTPERIYRILERRQQLLDDKPLTRTNNLLNLWQKIVNYKYLKKLAMTTAIAAGTIFCFSIISYLSINHQIIEDNQSENKQKLDDSNTDI